MALLNQYRNKNIKHNLHPWGGINLSCLPYNIPAEGHI